MRRIRKKTEPRRLTEWRAAHQSDVNFGYRLLLLDSDLRPAIIRSLLEDQGEICAYTGLGIREDTCHIEHLKPQTHCQPGETVAYANMVACFPAPNEPEVPYGAHRKKSWPDPTQAHLFVSPLDDNCEGRFLFDLRGQITPQNANDEPAAATIKALGLDHPLLTRHRKEAIEATLQIRGRGPASLKLSMAKRRFSGLEKAELDGGRLEPFCFALKQALKKHILRVRAIRRNKAGGR